MRIFATRWFVRFARKEKIADADLCEAVDRAVHGLVDADLGGHLIKQRIARKGQGRSGGYRVLIAFRSGDRSVFLYGFAKNERDNIDPVELADLKKLAGLFMGMTAAKLDTALHASELKEVSSVRKTKE